MYTYIIGECKDVEVPGHSFSLQVPKLRQESRHCAGGQACLALCSLGL